jgi:hypothetical protein
MTAPRITVLPNVLSNAVAPNTLGGVTAGPGTTQRSAHPSTMRQVWRIAIFAGFGLALLIEILGSRSW